MSESSTATRARATIGVGVIGFGWMGQAHARAYARLHHHFPRLPVALRLVAVADPVADRRQDAITTLQAERVTGRWQELLEDPLIQVVSVTVPNHLHADVGVAAARTGKHIWIEKPVGRSAAEAQRIAAAAARAGVQTAVGFNYRHAPAVAHARELIRRGRIGEVTHARFRLLSDYASHPDGALSWRFKRESAGPGVLGDLVSHGVDLARYLLGDIDAVVADQALFISQRPQAPGVTSHFATAAGGSPGAVENEDYVGCLLRMASGARATLEASRVSVGDQCNYGFEIHGTKGAVAWDFRRMGELGVCTGDSYQNQGLTTVFVGPGHGEFAAFQPGAAVAMSYDDLKVIEAANFVRSVVESRPYGATIEDGVRAALAIEAMAASAESERWVRVPTWPGNVASPASGAGPAID